MKNEEVKPATPEEIERIVDNIMPECITPKKSDPAKITDHQAMCERIVETIIF